MLCEGNSELREVDIKQDIFQGDSLSPFFFFFLSGFSFTDTGDAQDSRGREGTIFYSTLPLPPTHEHSDIYLQLCTDEMTITYF